MKRLLPLFALLAAPAFAQDAAPAAEAPAAPAAPAAAAAPARPAPGSIVMPGGPRFDALPENEKEHVRRMAGFRAVRDDAERELLKLDDEAQARKEEILAENEEAKALHDKMLELLAELAATTNALEDIYRADEKLRAIDEGMKQAKAVVDANQDNLTKEVVASMHARMARQREALEKETPPPEIPQKALEAATNLVTRPAVFPNPAAPRFDTFVKPPRRPAPAPASAPVPAPAAAPAAE